MNDYQDSPVLLDRLARLDQVPFRLSGRPADASPHANEHEQNHTAAPAKPARILLPIDLSNCSLEVFSFVNQLAAESKSTITLLHVVNLNIMLPETRLIADLARLATQHLNRLARQLLAPNLPVRVLVRIGKPSEEILAESRESDVNLIVLASHGSGSRRPFRTGIAGKVLHAAKCDATLLRVRTRFNCEEDWISAKEVFHQRNSTSRPPSPKTGIASAWTRISSLFRQPTMHRYESL